MGDKDYIRTLLSSPDFRILYRILCSLYSVCTIKNLVSRSQTLDGYMRLSLDDVAVTAAEGDERYSGGGIIHDTELSVPPFQNYARLRVFGTRSYYVITIVVINSTMMRAEDQKLNITL